MARAAPGQRLPVDDHRSRVAGLEQEVVEAEVAVAGRARSGAQREPGRDVLDEESAELLVLGRRARRA